MKYQYHGKIGYDATKEEIVELANRSVFGLNGGFVRNFVSYSLDASCVRAYLEDRGFEVVKNWDCGHNGWAVTACGLKMSTNGYIFNEQKFGK